MGIQTMWLAVAIGAAMLVGCGGADPASPADSKAGRSRATDAKAEPTNPFSAMISGFQEMDALLKEQAASPPVDAVHFSKLLPFVPAPVGWEPGEREAQTTELGPYTNTKVEQEYHAVGDPTVTVTVTFLDGPVAAGLRSVIVIGSMAESETLKGHHRPFRIDGHPAIEEWTHEGGQCTITVLVEKRFAVAFSGSNVQETTLRKQFLDILDLKGLAQLARDNPPPGAQPTDDEERP